MLATKSPFATAAAAAVALLALGAAAAPQDAYDQGSCEGLGVKQFQGRSWVLTRRASDTYGSWGPWDDNAQAARPGETLHRSYVSHGTYSSDPRSSNTFSLIYGNRDFDEFLFETGDVSRWMIMRRSQLLRTNGDSAVSLTVQKSYKYSTPRSASMLNRVSAVFDEDPWLSVEAHGYAGTNSATDNAAHSMLYGERVAAWNNWRNNYGGGNVWVSGFCGAAPVAGAADADGLVAERTGLALDGATNANIGYGTALGGAGTEPFSVQVRFTAAGADLSAGTSTLLRLHHAAASTGQLLLEVSAAGVVSVGFAGQAKRGAAVGVPALADREVPLTVTWAGGDAASVLPRLYVDGAEVALTEDAGSWPSTIHRDNAVGAAAAANTELSNFFKGTVQRLAVYDRVLGLAEIAGSDCPASAGGPPLLQLGDSRLDGGDLRAVWTSDNRFTAISWSFAGAAVPGTCGNDGTGSSAWAHTAGCTRTHTMSVPLTSALRDCGFSGAQDGGSVWFYEATVDVRTVEPNTDVFGSVTELTTVTSVQVRVQVPKTAETASSDVTVFGEQITQAAVTLQRVELGTNAFTWTLDTSVQYPYELEATVTTSTGNTFESGPLVSTDSNCAGDADGCVQTHTITAAETTACLLSNVDLRTTFTIKCRTDAVECSLPQGRETFATFTVSTDNFCGQVVEVAEVEPSLVTYSDEPGSTDAVDFVLQSTVHARLAVRIEAGLRVDKVELTGVRIHSQEADAEVLPFGDLSAAFAAYRFEWDGAGGQPGEAQTDFSFRLSEASVTFPGGSSTGQASLQITAWATVHYTAASGQTGKRQVRVAAAAAGQGSITTQATTQIGAARPAASSSSPGSAAGSTVLGVQAGTAVLAVVGVLAVAAVAVGAAVATRRRTNEAGQKRRLEASSSSSAVDAAADLELQEHGAEAMPGAASA